MIRKDFCHFVLFSFFLIPFCPSLPLLLPFVFNLFIVVNCFHSLLISFVYIFILCVFYVCVYIYRERERERLWALHLTSQIYHNVVWIDTNLTSIAYRNSVPIQFHSSSLLLLQITPLYFVSPITLIYTYFMHLFFKSCKK